MQSRGSEVFWSDGMTRLGLQCMSPKPSTVVGALLSAISYACLPLLACVYDFDI